MSKKKNNNEVKDINEMFDENKNDETLHTYTVEKSNSFEKELEKLAKKINPKDEWGVFYSEVKKNKYFGHTFDDFIKWAKKKGYK